MKKFSQKFKISFNKNLGGAFFKLTIEAPQFAKIALPGQFANIKVSDNYEPFLRRPLSVHATDKGRVEFLYQVAGEATKILSQKKPGEFLDLIGPLGNGFKINNKTKANILVAGGMGVAPLLFLAQKLVHSPWSIDHRHIFVLIGAKTKNQILCKKEFKNFGCEVKIATDDASCGFKGYVSDLLKKVLQDTGDKKQTMIYACGPRPMLKEVASISKKYKIPAQISLEEHMACGIGACFGCAVSTRQGYKRACKDGPVFSAEEIIY
jgi:dihydroorotate dehydrogenase electron transfer subunit